MIRNFDSNFRFHSDHAYIANCLNTFGLEQEIPFITGVMENGADVWLTEDPSPYSILAEYIPAVDYIITKDMVAFL